MKRQPRPVVAGEPGNVDARQLPLQRFEQGHEIPHGKDVVLHEDVQGGQGVDRLVDGMVEQGRLERREAVVESGERVHRCGTGPGFGPESVATRR